MHLSIQHPSIQLTVSSSNHISSQRTICLSICLTIHLTFIHRCIPPLSCFNSFRYSIYLAILSSLVCPSSHPFILYIFDDPLSCPGPGDARTFLEHVAIVGPAPLLTLILLAHPHRHRVCLHRDRVPPECILHHHPGLGHILLVPVLPVGAALGALQPQLEHTAVHGGHHAQEQEHVDHPQLPQLYLPCHRVLGVRPASLNEGVGEGRKEGRAWVGADRTPHSLIFSARMGSHYPGWRVGARRMQI